MLGGFDIVGVDSPESVSREGDCEKGREGDG